MINVSNTFKTKLDDGEPLFLQVDIVFSDGSTETFDTEIMTGENALNDGAGSSSFPVGAAICKSITVLLDNSEEQYKEKDFFGAKMHVYLAFDDEGAGRIDKGVFTVTSPEEYGDVITLTGYDDMYKADKEYTTKLTFPQTLFSLVKDACGTLGISMGFSSMAHGSFLVPGIPEGTTFRTFFGWAAMIECANARMDTRGYLQFKKWNFSEEDKPEFEDFVNSPAFSTSDIQITGIQVKNGEKTYLSGEKGYVLELENRLVAEESLQTVAGWLGDALNNVTFRSMEGELADNPLIEFGDVVCSIDRRDNKYVTPITDVSYSCGGRTTIKTQADDPIRGSRYQSAAGKALIEAREIVEKERTEREKALEKMSQELAAGSGMYATYEDQPDGSTITYLHDKPTLAESKTVIKLTSEAIGVSNDSGKTYPYGFILNGELITRLLYAEGINADYIDAGALTVRDKDRNVIFQADISGGKVIISADSVKIGDRNVTEALQQVTEDVASAKNMTFTLSNTYLSVPVDNDGNYKSFPGDEIKPNVMYGTVDITDACAYFISKSSGISGKWDANNRVYTVTGLSTDTGWIDFTALYATSLKVTKRFTAAKLYAGAKGDKGSDGRSYILASSVPMIQLDGDDFHIPSAVTFSAYYRDGDNEERKTYVGRFKIETTSDGTTWSTIYTSSQNESSVTRVLDYALCDDDGSIITDENGNMLSATPRKLSEIRCTLYQAGGMSTVIDSMSVPGVVAAKQITQEELFNILTNNGKAKGLFFEGGQLYISFTYAKGGQLVLGGVNNGRGELYVYDESGNVVGSWTKDGIDAKKGTFSGNLNAAKISGSTVTGSKITGSTIDGTTITSKGTVEDIQRNVEIQNGYVGINMGASYDVETLQKVGALTAVRTDLSTPYGGAVVVSQRNAIGIQSNAAQGAIVLGFGDRDSATWDDTPLIVYPQTKNNGVTYDPIVSMTQARAGKVSADIFQLGDASASKTYGSAPCFRKSTGNHPVRLSVTDGSSTDAYNTYFDIFGSVDVTGTLKVSGTKNRAVKTSCGTVLLNALETPEAVFADFGSAIISETGSVHIFIDPLFAETIDIDCKYQAFLTKTSKGGIDYVEKHTDHMIVYGKAHTEFDWFIAARQKEYSADRLNMTEPMAAQPVAFDDSVFVDEKEEINNAWKYLDITENTMIEMLEETIC